MDSDLEVLDDVLTEVEHGNGRRLLSEPETARYISMSRAFLRQSRMDGNRHGRTPGPPWVKLGRAVRYDIHDLDA